MKQKSTVLYCFSPPIMLATFILESALLVYVLWRYKMTALTRVVAALLVFLATFQLAEYRVCIGSADAAAFWSRVGFVAITLLPPLGIHLAHLIAERQKRLLVYMAYASGILWVLLFGTSDWAFAGYVCGDNYVVFNLRGNLIYIYALYYYGWILTSILSATYFARKSTKKQTYALHALIAGYLVFLVPTATVNLFRPGPGSIPSIMCGFAVLFALILTFCVLPVIATRTKR